MNRELVARLLHGIETGDPESVRVVDEARYVQHNPTTKEGSVGLAELFARISRTSPQVRIIRIFEDGHYVFGHVEYDFAEQVTGFEVFRFEDGSAVEHWDNLQARAEGPNASGNTMTNGPTEISDIDRTETNRALVEEFARDVLVSRNVDELDRYVNDAAGYVEHNPGRGDGVTALRAALAETDDAGRPRLEYRHVHRVLAEGNFVLCVGEGSRDAVHSAFYDLYRIEADRLVEHWDSIERVPPRSEWNNDNGKF